MSWEFGFKSGTYIFDVYDKEWSSFSLRMPLLILYDIIEYKEDEQLRESYLNCKGYKNCKEVINHFGDPLKPSKEELDLVDLEYGIGSSQAYLDLLVETEKRYLNHLSK